MGLTHTDHITACVRIFENIHKEESTPSKDHLMLKLILYGTASPRLAEARI